MRISNVDTDLSFPLRFRGRLRASVRGNVSARRLRQSEVVWKTAGQGQLRPVYWCRPFSRWTQRTQETATKHQNRSLSIGNCLLRFILLLMCFFGIQFLCYIFIYNKFFMYIFHRLSNRFKLDSKNIMWNYTIYNTGYDLYAIQVGISINFKSQKSGIFCYVPHVFHVERAAAVRLR